jgi:hypothetical protein
MGEITAEERLSRVERQVTELATRDDVRALSDQILHLAAQMQVGFSALREEIRAGDEETRRVLREEIRAGDEETCRVLRGEIHGGDEETRRYMRILYEDLVERLGKVKG